MDIQQTTDEDIEARARKQLKWYRGMGGLASADSFIMNMTHAYNQMLTSFDQNERKYFWTLIRLLATDLKELTEQQACPEPSNLLYAQLEAG